jgi:hypothetical protein
VDGLLAAKIKRRTLALAAAVAIPAAMACAGLTMAAPAQAAGVAAHAAGVPAQAAGVSMTITAMNPQFAGPGATVALRGTVHNGTGQTQAGLEVQLIASATGFTTRDDMESFLRQGGNGSLVSVGTPYLISASVKPGATAEWSASFQVSSLGITVFGVYPVAAQLQDSAGDVLTSAQTLLPFWPGQAASGLLRPLNISWLWPLIDQPRHQVCSALTNNDLATSLSPGGRLSALVQAGASYADADLTWVIDPALLSDAATMRSPYQVDPKANCTGARNEPPSQAAAKWLAALKAATADQQKVVTPYANVDMTALVHQGLTADLASAYATGDAVARSVLGETFPAGIAWPAGGTTNLSVLTDLATAEHVRTVVLSSGQMPPETSGYEPDDAVTSIQTGAGTTMNVLLADDTLTGLLRSSGSVSNFAVEQRFLAETAMIAAEAPNSARSVVVAPPENWSPSRALASGLLGETVSAPWLKAATLNSLTTTQDPERTVSRQALPASTPSPGELSRAYLSQVSALGARLGVYKSMLYQVSPSYLQSLTEALSATESSAWRGDATAQGRALVQSLSGYLQSAEHKVQIVTSAHQVPMAGASGLVPVSIQNGLHQAIRVQVNASAVNLPNRSSQLTIGHFDNLVIVPAGDTATVKLPVSSAPQGSTVIDLSLTSANGKPLAFANTSITVNSTRYGRAILFLIGAAIGVFVLTSVYRAVRRWMADDSHVVNEEADPPGSVVTGSSAQHPTEAPDDLADARRWADDA